MLIGVSNFLLHEFYNPYLATAHSPAPTCRHTRTPQQLYLHHLCTPTCSVPYTPLHTQQLYPHHFTRTTCAHPHAESPTHPYTHSSFTRTTCAHPHAHSPAHPYTHSCHTYTHTLIALPAPPVHTLTPTYKYLQISIAHNCHNPYLQISINIHIPPITILTIKIQSSRVDNKRI